MTNMIDTIIWHPPLWFLTIISAILVAHVFRSIVNLVLSPRRANSGALLVILELIGAMVLAYLTLHTYYAAMLGESHPDRWYDQPFMMLSVFVIFIFSSMVIYVLLRRALRL